MQLSSCLPLYRWMMIRVLLHSTTMFTFKSGQLSRPSPGKDGWENSVDGKGVGIPTSFIKCRVIGSCLILNQTIDPTKSVLLIQTSCLPRFQTGIFLWLPWKCWGLNMDSTSVPQTFSNMLRQKRAWAGRPLEWCLPASDSPSIFVFPLFSPRGWSGVKSLLPLLSSLGSQAERGHFKIFLALIQKRIPKIRLPKCGNSEIWAGWGNVVIQ